MKKYFKPFVLFLIFFFAIYKRVTLFDQIGKDIFAYEKSVVDLLEGRNPYVWTVESYSNPDDPGNHGYAYLPGLLYFNTIFYVISLLTKLPFQYLWKVPILLADIGVGIVLVKLLRKKSFAACIFGLLVWFFNPYFYMKNNYVFTDPLPVFFMLLSLYFLEEDDVLSGVSYALAVACKNFPVILFPIYLLKAKDKVGFLVAGLLVGLFVSVPFMRSINDFSTYLQGALFVHGDRFIQGRPFLFYISYFYKVELFQIIPFKVYTYLAMLSGWILVILMYLLKWLRDKFTLSVLPFLTFYLFTPVLNRTHLIWFLPLFIVGLFNFFYVKKYRWVFYVLLCSYWVFYYWYLLQWKDGFHIWRPL